MSSRLIRWGGVAMILVGVLGIVQGLLLLRYPNPPGPQAAALYTYEIAWGGTAALLAVFALAIRQIHLQGGSGFDRLGRLAVFLLVLSGVLFSIKTLIGLVTLLTGATVPFFIWPMFMLPGTIGAILGPVLLGIAILRARIMPAWFGWLQTLSLPLTFAVAFVGESYRDIPGVLIALILGAALLSGHSIRGTTPVSGVARSEPSA